MCSPYHLGASQVRFECSHCRGILEIAECEPGEAVACGHCGSAVAVPESNLAPGAVIGDFVLREELGRGGMGVVFLAHQVSLDRDAAVKILHEQFAVDERYIANFIREARAAAHLNHPGIVQAYAVGEDEGLHYFAMEYVGGSTLKEVLMHSGRMVPERALEIVRIVAEALDFGWTNQHLVHRDIKPDNIMLTTTGTIKLADLGLARWGADNGETTGEVHGTPQYISPEQLLGQSAAIGADIYSLGATLYHMLSGQFPYQGDTAVAIAEKHLFEPLTPLGKVAPGVPPELCQVVEVMMAKRPGHRYRDTAELIGDLRRVERGEQPLRSVAAGSQEPVNVEVGLDVPEEATPTPAAAPVPGKRPIALKLRPAAPPAVSTERQDDLAEAHVPVPEYGDTPVEGEEPEVPEPDRRKLVPILVSVLVLLLVGGAAAYYFVFMGGKKGEEGKTAEVATGTQEAADALAAVRELQSSGAGTDQVATALGDYATKYSLGELGDGFWQLAGPLVAQDLATARAEAENTELEAWRAEHDKLAADAAKRKEEAEREAAEAAQRQTEEAVRKEEAEKQAAAAAELAARQDEARWKAVEKCRANEYSAAESLFAPFLSDEHPEVVAWAKAKMKCVDLAQTLYERIYNSKKALAGAQLPVPQSRKKWTVTFIGPKNIEAEMTTTVYEKGEGRQETKQLSLSLDEADEQIYFLLISHLATVDKTVDTAQLQLEFGAFLVSRAKYLSEAQKRLSALPGTKDMLAEVEILAKKAEQ